MISAASYPYSQPNQRLVFDELSGKFFLNVHIQQAMVSESVSVQLPDEVALAYVSQGHKGLLSFASKVESDYHRFRFANLDGKATFPYVQASAQQGDEIFACFEDGISLLEVEIIRLLYLLESDSAIQHINHLYTKGYRVPLDVFCLGIRFFYDSPLTDIHNQILRETSDRNIVVKDLESNPLYGCPDAALMLLGAIAHSKNPVKELFHLKCLTAIVAEPNCLEIKDCLQSYIELSASYNYSTIFAEEFNYAEIYAGFKQDFPVFADFTLGVMADFPYWANTEALIAWNGASIDCLIAVFARRGLAIDYTIASNMLVFPRGADSDWQSYSVGQSINYNCLNVDEFNENNVAKPKFPATGNEAFIVGLWQNYLYYFADMKQLPRATIEAALTDFVSEWNGASQ